jgi:hypothetical protein
MYTSQSAIAGSGSNSSMLGDIILIAMIYIICDLSDQNLQNILMEVVMALPPTSVKCDTAFSAMKLLKTKRRGRLGNRRLNDLKFGPKIAELVTYVPT